MGIFLLDLRVGERLSYGMALSLVVVAQQIATGGMIPMSNERLWVDKFVGWSFYWVIVGLVESVFVGYLYFLRQDIMLDNEDNSDSDSDGRRMYHGLRQSSLNQKSTDHHDENNVVEQHNDPQEEVDVDAPYDASTIPLTLKLQLQQQQQQNSTRGSQQDSGPRPKRRHTLIEPGTNKSSGITVGGKYWNWMYTISLRKMDRFFFFLTLSSYTLFLIAMFVSIPYWGVNVQNVWVSETASLESTVSQAFDTQQ